LSTGFLRAEGISLFRNPQAFQTYKQQWQRVAGGVVYWTKLPQIAIVGTIHAGTVEDMRFYVDNTANSLYNLL
jgi:hypothetical protein